MRATVILGVLLIVLGVVALAYQGITYTKKEEVLNIGPIQATTEKKETIPVPPLVGALAVAGGVLLVVAGSRKRS